jgi:ParB-like nuclease domain/Pyruvate phosphate dikinase, AMP/ATP-binding domain
MTEKEYVLTLTGPQAAELAVAGGKGAALARLFAAGLPVPWGFVLTTAAYQQFVADNDLAPTLLCLTSRANAGACQSELPLPERSRGISKDRVPKALGLGAVGEGGFLISGQFLVQIVMWEGSSHGREQQRVREQLDEARYGPPLLIPVDQIDPNPRNPRRVFDEQALNELAESIKQWKQLQPIVVRRVGERFELIRGERRWRAHQRAGLEKIWAVEREASDTDAYALALVENIQRVDLSHTEKVRLIRLTPYLAGPSQTRT